MKSAHDKIRVLVADDSEIAAEACALFLEQDGDIAVVGKASSGEDLLALVNSLAPDVVVSDLLMPGGTGLSVVSTLVDKKVGVVIVSAMDKQTGIQKEVMAQGAVFFGKNQMSADGGKALRDVVRELSQKNVLDNKNMLMLLGSAGSPRVIESLIPSIIESKVPTFFFLHLSDKSSQAIATWISRQGLSTEVASKGMRLTGSSGVVPAPGVQLLFEKPGRVNLGKEDKVDGHCPSASVLLKSASWLGTSLTAIVLSGMGKDGHSAVKTAIDAGVHVFAQDPNECVVDSMPNATLAESNLVKSVTIAEMKKMIVKL